MIHRDFEGEALFDQVSPELARVFRWRPFKEAEIGPFAGNDVDAVPHTFYVLDTRSPDFNGRELRHAASLVPCTFHHVAASAGAVRPPIWFVRDGGLFIVEAPQANGSL